MKRFFESGDHVDCCAGELAIVPPVTGSWYQRTCATCGEEVSFEHIVKGYEYEPGKYVVLDEEDFDKVPVESSRAIDIIQFVDQEDIFRVVEHGYAAF